MRGDGVKIGLKWLMKASGSPFGFNRSPEVDGERSFHFSLKPRAGETAAQSRECHRLDNA